MRSPRRIASGLVGAAALLALPGLIPAAGALAKTAPASRNVNFVGTWKVTDGVGFTVTHENLGSGVCAGVSALKSSGYGFTGCRVSGRHYRFIITFGANYRSVNTGTISGNHLSGHFDDGSTVSPYTATRIRR